VTVKKSQGKSTKKPKSRSPSEGKRIKKASKRKVSPKAKSARKVQGKNTKKPKSPSPRVKSVRKGAKKRKASSSKSKKETSKFALKEKFSNFMQTMRVRFIS